MIQKIRALLQPLTTLNRRISIGGGGLALILGGQTALALIGPFA